MTNSPTVSSVEDRALTLLGQGISPDLVANACGVTLSRISQLVSDPEFSKKVAELRYAALSKHNARDNKYDDIEDKLVEKMKDMIPLMFEPMKVLAAIRVINAAQRRGQSAPESIQGTKEVVSLIMPTVLIQQFSKHLHLNQNNQVIKAGEQELVTVQSVQMSKLLAARKGSTNELVIENSPSTPATQQAA